MQQPLLYQLFKSCLTQEYQEESNGASWAFERREDQLSLWFQHSHGVADWLNNLRAAAVPYREMSPPWRCHKGFLSVFKSLIPRLEPLIKDPTVKQICTVGYSHGAALAVLCHEYIWYHRPDLRESIQGYGYGCPRVLYGCVPEELATRWQYFYVIRNLDDVVTHLPPRMSGYCHVGTLITIGTSEKYSATDAHRPESYLAELSATARIE